MTKVVKKVKGQKFVNLVDDDDDNIVTFGDLTDRDLPIWSEHEDSQGRTYYYNRQTEESTWIKRSPNRGHHRTSR